MSEMLAFILWLFAGEIALYLIVRVIILVVRVLVVGARVYKDVSKAS